MSANSKALSIGLAEAGCVWADTDVLMHAPMRPLLLASEIAEYRARVDALFARPPEQVPLWKRLNEQSHQALVDKKQALRMLRLGHA